MTIISTAHEQVSITGTAIVKIPLTGHPEFSGLLADDDSPPVVRIEDGALVIECDDLDLAIKWRNVWQHAIAHLIENRERKAGRP